MIRPGLRWAGLALLGLGIAAFVAVLASQMMSQRIGLASEPASAGRALAPPSRGLGNPPHRPTPPVSKPKKGTAPATRPPSSGGDETAGSGDD